MILEEKFNFFREDVFLCALVDTEKNSGKIILQKINLKTKKVEISDSLDCIHALV